MNPSSFGRGDLWRVFSFYGFGCSQSQFWVFFWRVWRIFASFFRNFRELRRFWKKPLGFYEKHQHSSSGSTISTLLHDKINPKNFQVLSLGDTGVLQFFRVVSRDYGKPRSWEFTRYFHNTNHFCFPPTSQSPTYLQPLSQRKGWDELLNNLVFCLQKKNHEMVFFLKGCWNRSIIG